MREWRAHRIETGRARCAARIALHELTPATREAAIAFVRYTGDLVSHAHHMNAKSARRAALRRLREVFARPGACLPPLTHHPPLPG